MADEATLAALEGIRAAIEKAGQDIVAGLERVAEMIDGKDISELGYLDDIADAIKNAGKGLRYRG